MGKPRSLAENPAKSVQGQGRIMQEPFLYCQGQV